jgi:predicted nucleotidyltransferase component of viral defense system
LRFFFNSLRYSEDIDLDICGVNVAILTDIVMKILQNSSFHETLRPYGIESVVSPDISKAKQTETTQRFKAHLITSSGEDLFTKIDFSRRGIKGKVSAQAVSAFILREYKMPPILIPHYEIDSAIIQKIEALAARSVTQARDIFDLYILTSQGNNVINEKAIPDKLTRAYDNIFMISFEQFRDTVLAYLTAEDQAGYNTTASWDEIKLKVSAYIDELRKKNA